MVGVVVVYNRCRRAFMARANIYASAEQWLVGRGVAYAEMISILLRSPHGGLGVRLVAGLACQLEGAILSQVAIWSSRDNQHSRSGLRGEEGISKSC